MSDKKLRVLFTGDSITDADRTTLVRGAQEWLSQDPTATAERKNQVVNGILGAGYPLLVASQLSGEEPDRYEFLNRGVSGNRIVDLDARIKVDCINLKPDVVSILIGVNDVWHQLGEERNGVDAEKFRRVYESMLREIHQALPGVKFLLLEPYVLPGPATRDQWEVFRREVDKRRQVVQELAQLFWVECDLHIPVIDTQRLLDQACERSSPAHWSADGVHPTPAGHWLIAQEWIRRFQDL